MGGLRMTTISAGDVVEDNYGRHGIVIREEPFPGSQWISSQADPRLSDLGADERWLGVIPFGGGLVITPASLTTRIRAATRDDFLIAVDSAGEHGVRYLAAVFPDWTREVMMGK